MAFQLPVVANSAHFQVGVELDRVSYQLRLRWNPRLEVWVLDVLDADGAQLAAGVRVVVNVPLLDRLGYEGLPAGTLIPIDTSDQDLDAAFGDLGRRVVLLYLTADEVG